jgi:TrmH RNA methyltransferase
MSRKDALVYGRRACLAVAESRPIDILRVFYTTEGEYKDLGPLLRACATQRKPYREVSSDELGKICKSTHHEGVVVVVQRTPRVRLEERWNQSKHDSSCLPIWVAFDGVANDHNLGAIARSLAWFGGSGLLWEGDRPMLSGSALRIAQGGAEHLHLVTTPHLVRSLQWMKSQGCKVVGADQSAHRSLFDFTLSQRGSGTTPPLCWVLGNEQFGLSKTVREACDQLVSIPGSGWVESMNVSVSAGILISYSHAQYHQTLNK